VVCVDVDKDAVTHDGDEAGDAGVDLVCELFHFILDNNKK